MKSHSDRGLQAFSIDVKDLYYSLPHRSVLSCVEQCIDKYGAVSFQNEAGMSCSQFLELLQIYLNSTFITWDNQCFLQKSGVCIGSCIAPILSDLFLSCLDRDISLQVQGTAVFKTFRYVDDFLIFIDCSSDAFILESKKALETFQKCLVPFKLLMRCR